MLSVHFKWTDRRNSLRKRNAADIPGMLEWLLSCCCHYFRRQAFARIFKWNPNKHFLSTWFELISNLRQKICFEMCFHRSMFRFLTQVNKYAHCTVFFSLFNTDICVLKILICFSFGFQGYHRPNHYIATQGKNRNTRQTWSCLNISVLLLDLQVFSLLFSMTASPELSTQIYKRSVKSCGTPLSLPL